MNACPEKPKAKMTEDPDLNLIRKWVNQPKAKHIKIHHLFDDHYRVNVFMALNLPDCVVEKLVLSDSYFVLVKNGKVINKTKPSVLSQSQQNIFK